MANPVTGSYVPVKVYLRSTLEQSMLFVADLYKVDAEMVIVIVVLYHVNLTSTTIIMCR